MKTYRIRLRPAGKEAIEEFLIRIDNRTEDLEIVKLERDINYIG